MNVCMQHDKEEMLFNWTSSFGNKFLGTREYLLGADGTIAKTGFNVRYQPETVNRPDGQEIVGDEKSEGHMQNFVDAIRLGKPPNAPFELGFKTSITCRMCVDSYVQQRTLRWDAEKEIIV